MILTVRSGKPKPSYVAMRPMDFIYCPPNKNENEFHLLRAMPLSCSLKQHTQSAIKCCTKTAAGTDGRPCRGRGGVEEDDEREANLGRMGRQG